MKASLCPPGHFRSNEYYMNASYFARLWLEFINIYDNLTKDSFLAEVAELVDAPALGAGGIISHGSSTLPLGIIHITNLIILEFACPANALAETKLERSEGGDSPPRHLLNITQGSVFYFIECLTWFMFYASLLR